MSVSAALTHPRGRRASFDAGSQHRRVMIAKVKLAQKELGICDDDYRAILLRETGECSAANCTEAQLGKMLDVFRSKGWQAKPKRAVPRAASSPQAMKARALWISLYHLNAIDDASETALEAFARRQLKCERLAWADQGQMFKLVEALKAIGERHGWDQHITELKVATTGSHRLRLIKLRLCQAILAKLKAKGLAAETWNLAGAARNIAGITLPEVGGASNWELSLFDQVAATLGHLLRTGERSSS